MDCKPSSIPDFKSRLIIWAQSMDAKQLLKPSNDVTECSNHVTVQENRHSAFYVNQAKESEGASGNCVSKMHHPININHAAKDYFVAHKTPIFFLSLRGQILTLS